MLIDIKIFPAVEKEALDLAAEMRDFLRYGRGRKDLRDVPLLFLACERIQWVVAWTLYQKAIFADELTASEAAEDLRDMAERAIADDPPIDEGTDPRLRSLVERSGRLFARIQRLLKPAPVPTGAARPRIAPAVRRH